MSCSRCLKPLCDIDHDSGALKLNLIKRHPKTGAVLTNLCSDDEEFALYYKDSWHVRKDCEDGIDRNRECLSLIVKKNLSKLLRRRDGHYFDCFGWRELLIRIVAWAEGYSETTKERMEDIMHCGKGGLGLYYTRERYTYIDEYGELLYQGSQLLRFRYILDYPEANETAFEKDDLAWQASLIFGHTPDKDGIFMKDFIKDITNEKFPKMPRRVEEQPAPKGNLDPRKQKKLEAKLEKKKARRLEKGLPEVIERIRPPPFPKIDPHDSGCPCCLNRITKGENNIKFLDVFMRYLESEFEVSREPDSPNQPSFELHICFSLWEWSRVIPINTYQMVMVSAIENGSVEIRWSKESVALEYSAERIMDGCEKLMSTCEAMEYEDFRKQEVKVFTEMIQHKTKMLDFYAKYTEWESVLSKEEKRRKSFLLERLDSFIKLREKIRGKAESHHQRLQKAAVHKTGIETIEESLTDKPEATQEDSAIDKITSGAHLFLKPRVLENILEAEQRATKRVSLIRSPMRPTIDFDPSFIEEARRQKNRFKEQREERKRLLSSNFNHSGGYDLDQLLS
ncbi:MAG: hypothetical protein M1824_000741 [Vezdaea acicularis]|nr:MAG: hypothetical protein M1824_000741 [Vezdaea acicularis]